MVEVRVAKVRMDLAGEFATTRAAGETIHAASIAGREWDIVGVDFQRRLGGDC